MSIMKDRCWRNIERTFEKIQKSVYTYVSPLELDVYVTPEPLPYAQRAEGKHIRPVEGEKWGNMWDCAWFRVRGRIPAEAAGKSVVLYIDVSGECLIFDDNGNPVHGLTHVEHGYGNELGMSTPKRIVRIAPNANGGEEIDFWMDVGRNCLLGETSNMTLGKYFDGFINTAQVAICDEEMWQLHFDYDTLMNLMKALSPESARHAAVFYALKEATVVLKNYTPDEVARAREILAKELNKKGGDPSLTLIAQSHSHIDLAWLWPLRETRRKGGRTFSNVLMLMERYKSFIFGASQPQLYQWVKEDYPDIYRRIKERVSEGRWELQGGMWVEPDTNVPSGESLIRQFLYGKRFYMDEFGQEIRNLWLPDVFGYSAALPQIMKKCGVDYFMTNKLAANEITRFPHHTFVWEGIDGTRVVSHMTPEGTYNGSLMPQSLMHAEKQYIEKGMCDEALILFGIGDGGGGPGEEHLERYNRLQNLEGLSPMRQGFVQEFFDHIGEKADQYDVYRGELYFDRHQGTFTTQAKAKWYNRHLEFALHELEMLLAMSNPEEYPKDELEEIWKETLLYQFHDILPGSSIPRVYDESYERSEIMMTRLNELMNEACARISGDKLAVNSLSWDRWDWLEIDGKSVKVSAKALSAAPVETIEADLSSLKANGLTIENADLKVIFNEDGSMASVYDKKADRETLRAAGNKLAVWEDRGDCWDIPIEYLYLEPEYFELKEQTAGVDGSKAFMKQVYTYNKSTVTQTICLEEGRPYVDVRTVADWHEDYKMLRTSFDVDIVADSAAHEIQFGYLRRSLNENNPYETAKFETCAHKWVDMSQSGYGVALMNDCKYGYRVKGTTMDLNLLRAQDFPGVGSDRGEHIFRYALYPHIGDTGSSDVARRGYEYNLPLSIRNGGGSAAGNTVGNSMFEVDGGIILDTVKRAENGSGTVLRFYEPCGSKSRATVKLNGTYSKAQLCDMLENPEGEVSIESGMLCLELAPFEVKTILLVD